MISDNFSTYYELFIAFNWAYVGSKGVKLFVNNKVFGLTDKRMSKISSIKAKIETKKSLKNEDSISDDLKIRLEESKRRLNKIEKIIPECIDNIQERYSICYLISGLFGLIMVYTTACSELKNQIDIVFNFASFTLFFITLMALLIRVIDSKLNTLIFTTTYVFGCICLLVCVLTDNLFFKINVSEPLVLHFANSILLYPFALHFVVTLFFDNQIRIDINNADKLSNDDGDLLTIFGFRNKKNG